MLRCILPMNPSPTIATLIMFISPFFIPCLKILNDTQCRNCLFYRSQCRRYVFGGVGTDVTDIGKCLHDLGERYIASQQIDKPIEIADLDPEVLHMYGKNPFFQNSYPMFWMPI